MRSFMQLLESSEWPQREIPSTKHELFSDACKTHLKTQFKSSAVLIFVIQAAWWGDCNLLSCVVCIFSKN